MKISHIEHSTYEEVKALKQFNTQELPNKAKWYLQLLAWILALPETFLVRSNITKTNMKGLKGPYILLCNHNSFLDFKVATRAIFPKSSTYIVAIDGFINREKIMKNVGCFMTRKFISDQAIYKQVKHSLDNGVICQIYPEARYSLVGTNSMLPPSLSKLIKKLEYSVVTLISHGHHLRQPFWNLKKRKVKTKSYLTQILTPKDIASKSTKEIETIINDSFTYNDYKFQKDNSISIYIPDRAEGLHKPLFICPHCKTEHQMTSKGNKIICAQCHEEYTMNHLGELHHKEKGLFTHIPDWFEWQRQVIKNQIINDEYEVSIDVVIEMLPNSTGFYRIGEGKLIHNNVGVTLIHKDFTLKRKTKTLFGIHIEYDYFDKGDCVSISSLTDTFYIYAKDQTFNVTKLHFGVEEMHKLNKKAQ